MASSSNDAGTPPSSFRFRFTYFQSLTNCLKFATLSEPLYFQRLPTVKFYNSFVLITIQNAGGGYGGPLRITSSFTLTPPLCSADSVISVLKKPVPPASDQLETSTLSTPGPLTSLSRFQSGKGALARATRIR